MAGVVHVPWYATVFRGDKLEEALAEIAPMAMRYGAASYSVYRYSDDRYKFLQTAEFADHTGWDAYWYGKEFNFWRAKYQSCFQVPVVYGWTDLITIGSLVEEDEHSGAGAAPATHEGDLAG
jgi:hypothetical protein